MLGAGDRSGIVAGMRPPSWFRRHMAETVIVHTVDGRSIRGALTGVYAETIVLSASALLSPSGAEDLVGETIVPRERISFMQRTSPAQPFAGSEP